MTDAAHLAALLATFDSSTPALTLFRVAPGVRMAGPPVDGVAVLLVLSGDMLLEVEGEPARTVPAGSLALVSAGRPALLSAVGMPVVATVEGRTSLRPQGGWLVADAARGHDPALVVAAGRIAGSNGLGGTGTLIIPVTACRIAKPIFLLLRAECEAGAAGLPALAAALMNACVIQGLRRAIAAAPNAAPGPAERGLIARAVAAIRTRPAEPHTVDTLASVAGMSRSTFIRHFKRAFRVAPSEYIQQVRLEEARTMLEATELPVKTIAARAGFASRSHFSRLFRATFGHDPSGYRERGRDA
jgi:AraC-like DNA-binding protein